MVQHRGGAAEACAECWEEKLLELEEQEAGTLVQQRFKGAEFQR